MMHPKILLLLLLLLLLAFPNALATPSIARAQEHGAPQEPPQAALRRKVDFKQRLNSQVPVDLMFTNDCGEEVSLADSMNGRPTILVLAYYRCPMLCNQELNGVARC